MNRTTTTTLSTHEAIAAIAPADWNAAANPDPAIYNPFVSHAFLVALEQAKTVGGRSGWRPHHVALRDASKRVVACAPAYIKMHSQGEYVFDHGWADAFERAGGSYYPKLQVAVPFTPVPGRRLLARPGDDMEANEQALAAGIVEVARQIGVSSAHITFMSESEWSRMPAHGLLQRVGQQFHWENRGYTTFDEFLASLASRKRKTVRKERATAIASGLAIEHVTGRAITEAHWDAFYAFYVDTGSRKWGRPYLNRTFFSLLGQAMADRCLLVMARREGRYVAGALNLIGGDCLYGRYWGAVEHHPCLHFELCYYQAIDYAIGQRLARVEAGAQGEHKLARGYMPTAVYSAHWIAHSGLRTAVGRFLAEERAAVTEQRELLAEYGPYKKTADEQD